MDAWEGANGRYKFNDDGELEDKPIYLDVYRNGVPAAIGQTHPAVVTEPQ
jgi:hypothetical protein